MLFEGFVADLLIGCVCHQHEKQPSSHAVLSVFMKILHQPKRGNMF